MNHLTEVEFVDLLDGSLPAERARHADACERCRTQFEHLRTTLASGTDPNVPEPSPLFWEHFAARVSDSIASAQVERTGWLPAIASMRALTAAGAIAAIVLITVISWGPRGDVRQPQPAGAVPGVARADPLFEGDEPGSEEGWAAVRAAADQVAWDEANEAGLAAQPGAADRAINNLTEAERAKLIALLAEELKKSGE